MYYYYFISCRFVCIETLAQYKYYPTNRPYAAYTQKGFLLKLNTKVYVKAFSFESCPFPKRGSSAVE